MKLSYSGSNRGEIKQRFDDLNVAMATAASLAVRDGGEFALRAGRADIAGAGFSKRWQDGLRVQYFPKNARPTINSVAVMRHRYGYAGVFEDGATISGRPLLFIPVEENLPPAPSGGRWTPRKYVSNVGPLVSVNRGRAPLLIAKTKNRGGRLRPLFVGIRSAVIRKRFRLAEVARNAVARLEGFYFRRLKV